MHIDYMNNAIIIIHKPLDDVHAGYPMMMSMNGLNNQSSSMKGFPRMSQQGTPHLMSQYSS